ncbi:hypothetical protein [Desulfoluna limicola]|nr:hypothetical protein [Desulfoluna limicola]
MGIRIVIEWSGNIEPEGTGKGLVGRRFGGGFSTGPGCEQKGDNQDYPVS